MAQNIWVDAFNNSLRKPGRLERYVKDDPDCVNKLGGEKSVTPLAYACFRGHLEVVTLLLTHGARPNVICPHGRTALFFTLTQASPNQLLIIKALLTASDGAADPNEVYPEDGGVNALTLAIEELRDNHIVESLIDAGAKPTPENKKQAKTRKMERSLLPWKEVAGSLVDLAVSAVSLIISYTDGGVLNTVTKGVMKNMYKITNAQNNPVGANIPEPKSPQDFKKNITNFVKNTGLERFFAKKPAFLQALAEKASVLRDDPTTDLGKPENIQRLTSLALYQLVIYCDDSGSMLGDARGYQTHPSNSRYHSLRQLVLRITNVATKLLPDNATVKVRFINDTRNHDVTASGVDAVMESVTPSGFTPLGTSLVEKILQPLVYDKISNPSYEFEQPLLVCTITDGVPSDGDTAPIKKVVADCRKGLVDKKYDPASVMFCISRIGADPGAKTFLDGLRDEKEIQDVVHCTADQLDTKFTELRENERELEVWLLEMLTKPIMRGPSSSP